MPDYQAHVSMSWLGQLQRYWGDWPVVTNFFQKTCATVKSSAILTGSADENLSGLTQELVCGVVEKIFKNFPKCLKIRCILQGFADRGELFEKSSGSLKTYSR